MFLIIFGIFLILFEIFLIIFGIFLTLFGKILIIYERPPDLEVGSPQLLVLFVNDGWGDWLEYQWRCWPQCSQPFVFLVF